MKTTPLKIYIDRLKNDSSEQINELIEPDFFDINEKELKLVDQVGVTGTAYLANDHLIIELKLQAKIQLPCPICNQNYILPIKIDSLTQTIEIQEIKSAIYDYSDDVRSNILLKIPHFTECHNGKCPSRNELNKYFKSKANTPFSDLEL